MKLFQSLEGILSAPSTQNFCQAIMDKETSTAQDPSASPEDLQFLWEKYRNYLQCPIPMRTIRGKVLSALAANPNTPPDILYWLGINSLYRIDVERNPVMPLLLLEDPNFWNFREEEE